MFKLHERLAADTIEVCDLHLCKLLLMNDCTYPWIIMVPRMPDIREITNLPEAERHFLMNEMSAVSKLLEDLTGADKMNIGALGNMVPQLHIHVIARFEGDAAWPAPVWGAKPAVAYSDEAANEILEKLRKELSGLTQEAV